MDAYESLNAFTKSLSKFVYTDNGMIHGSFCGKLGFDNFKLDVSKIINKSFWLDVITQQKLTELSAFLFNEVSGYIDEPWDEDFQNKKYVEFRVQHFEKIEEFRKTLEYFLNNKLKKHYMIDDFFNDDARGGKKDLSSFMKKK